MKCSLLSKPLPVTIALLILIFSLCAPAHAAQTGEWYLGLKGGTFSPSGELRDDGFGHGSAVELSYGQFVANNLALEAGIGSYETSSTDIGYYADEKEDLSITSLTFSVKGVLSTPRLELAGGAGLGNYFIEGRYEATVAGNKDSDSAASIVPGYHLMAEATLNVTRNFFLVLEDRYIQTQTMDLEYTVHGQHIRRQTGLDGNLFMFSIGMRF